MRKRNSINNFLTTFLPYVLIALLGFIKTKVFVSGLGDDTYALDQLFYQILAYISLAEGGVGLFIVQKYYKCFAENDKDQINDIFNSSKKVLKYIGLLMIVSGLVTSFFIGYLTNNSLTFSYMQIVFILFLLKNILDYFMFAPRFLLQGDQKLYKVNVWVNLIRILDLLLSIILVRLGVDYLLILIPGIIIKFILNIVINKIVYKEYPWLKDYKVLNIKMFKGIRHIFAQKVSGVVFYNTDIILISTFINPIGVVIYSAYNYISKSLIDVVVMFGNALSPSFGNVLFKENKQIQYETFEELNILFYFIGGFVSVLFLLLATPFVNLWVGSKYLIPLSGLIYMTLILYFTISRRMILITKDSLGLFKETKAIILLEAIINLTLSLLFLLVFKMGISGVLLATILSTLVTTFWHIPYHLFKNYFNKSFFSYIKIYILTVIIISLIYCAFKLILTFPIENFYQWFICALLYSIIIFVVMFLIFYVIYNPFRNLMKKWYKFLKVNKRKRKN